MNLSPARIPHRGAQPPGRPLSTSNRPMSTPAMGAIRKVLEHTGGDFTTLLTLEKFFMNSTHHGEVDFSGAASCLCGAAVFGCSLRHRTVGTIAIDSSQRVALYASFVQQSSSTV